MTRSQSLKILRAAGCSPREAAALLAGEQYAGDYLGIYPSDDGVGELTEDRFGHEVEVVRR